MRFKAIINIFMADRLLKAGFVPVEFKPSSRKRGQAAFIFEDTPEFRKAFRELTRKN